MNSNSSSAASSGSGLLGKSASSADLYRALNSNSPTAVMERLSVQQQALPAGVLAGETGILLHQDRKERSLSSSSASGASLHHHHGIDNWQTISNSGNSTAEKNAPAPELPLALGAFPVVPFHAILRGPYRMCFDAVLKVLTAPASGILVTRIHSDEGYLACILEGDKDGAFNIALWQVPDGSVLLELMVLSTESNHSWADTFDRLCSHGALRNLVLRRPQTLNANVATFGQFVKPVF